MQRILVIEDHPTNLELVVYLLESFGFQVATAIDGGEGLASAQQEKFDLIVCDIQLPVLDGFEVARRLKADAATRHVPLLAVTGMAMMGDREKVMAAGFDGYLPKPIIPAEFIKKIHAMLPPNGVPKTGSTGNHVQV